MKFGCSLIVRGKHATQENIRALASNAEAWGFDSVWVSDHIILPPLVTSVYPASPNGQFPDLWLERYFEPMAILNYVAGFTQRVQLGMSVLILPMRNPIEVAKEIAGADVLSQGRIVFGVGVGWFKEEFDVLREPFHQRGQRMDEYLEICKTLWTQEPATYEGQFYQFQEARFAPKPTQKPHPPIWIGGQSLAAIRRAVRYGDGWHPFALPPDGLKPIMAQFRTAMQDAGRPLQEVEVSLRVRLRFGETSDSPLPLHGSPEQVIDTIKQYEALGVQHLVIDAIPETIDNALSTFERFVREVVPAFR